MILEAVIPTKPKPLACFVAKDYSKVRQSAINVDRRFVNVSY